MHSDQNQHGDSGNGDEQDLELFGILEAEHLPAPRSGMNAGYRLQFTSQFR